MPRKRFPLFVVLPAAFILCGLVVFSELQRREPIYRGWTLSTWLKYYDFSDLREPVEVNEAIRHFGTNAIPVLLQMLRSKDPPLISKLADFVDRTTSANLHPFPKWINNLAAARAFHALGASASNAVPDLVKIYDENISSESQRYTLDSLGEVGPAARSAVPLLLRAAGSADVETKSAALFALGRIRADPALVVPELIKRLGDPDARSRMYAAKSLGNYGLDARPAISKLVVALTDTDYLVRYYSARALGEIRSGPDIAVPALTRALSDLNATTKVGIVNGLADFGPDARSALPALTNMLSDPDPNLVAIVKSAIEQISAEK